jgi:hypothetical protein
LKREPGGAFGKVAGRGRHQDFAGSRPVQYPGRGVHRQPSNVIVGHDHLAAVDGDPDRKPDRIEGWDECQPAADSAFGAAEDTRNESPAVSISRPPNPASTLLTTSSCMARVRFHDASPASRASAVEATMSVNRIDASARALSPGCVPNPAPPAQSIITSSSSPSTQVTCPGGRSKTWLGPITSCSPSSVRTPIRPLRTTPR